ncbi:MAG: tetratricopeptide repeat protein [Acidobacteria bacterium]|nr:tetratricopeptide repeat protein [Acidobacteriota bacterium]
MPFMSFGLQHSKGVAMAGGLLALVLSVCLSAAGQDKAFSLTLPKRGKLSPVQKLNREGVREVSKRHLEKAKKLFYEAYLIDPDDPFTLNNLGYISELDGDADRALRYYELSAKNATEATIDSTTRPELKGRPLDEAFAALDIPELKANKANIEAISLLGKGRIAEAEDVLRRALATDPRNPFTMNNMGFVMESEGDLQSALKYYSSAASLHASDVILVSPDVKWRGKAISEVAADNARSVNSTIAKGEDLQAQVARLNLRGVAALNHNDRGAAKEFFEEAYKLDPRNAFSLNNMGYVAELNGDRETAETYYADARSAADRNLLVTYASRREAEGQPVSSVAQQNENDTQAAIEALQTARRREGEPMPQLRRRDNSLVAEPEPELNKPAPPLNRLYSPPLPAPQIPERIEPRTPTSVPPQGGLLEPLPESQQPESTRTPANNIPPPQSGNTAPNAAPSTNQQPPLLEPLPDSQQPPASRTPGNQPGNQAQPNQPPRS